MHYQGRKSFMYSIILIFTVFSFFGCDDSGTDSNNGEEGSLVVKITDDPFPVSFVSEANVTIDRIEIRQAEENNGNPFITVSTDTHYVNLIDLRNGITDNLAEIEIPVGTYDLVRLYVAEASIVLTDNQVFDLTVPSGAQTGIKIFIEPSIVVEGGITSELLLDFDISKSFIVLGNPESPAGINGFHFKPVIRAVNSSTAGRLVGTVTDTASVALQDAQVWVMQDTVVSTTYSDMDGSYALIGLPAGSYAAYATKADYDTVMVSDVNIVAGNQTDENFELTPNE